MNKEREWNRKYIGVLIANVIYIAFFAWLVSQYNY